MRIENGNSHQQAELKGVEEYAIECSILKVAVSENLQNCADEGIQVFGGMGFSEETLWRPHGETLELLEFTKEPMK